MVQNNSAKQPSQVNSSANGAIAADGTMDCALIPKLPVLTYEINLVAYTIEPEFYVLKGQSTQGDTDAVECQLGIQGIPACGIECVDNILYCES